jgi:Flp pilus assembly protein CpaB
LKRSNRLVLLIGIFLAIVVFVLIIVTLGGGSPGSNRPSAAPTTGEVVVASKDLDLSATITSGDVTLKEIPLPLPAGSYSDTSLVIGQIARTPVTSGQLITSTVINGQDGSINNIAVPAGFVAMAVQVDQVTGVGTIIKTGDFVDVISGFTAEKVPLVIPGVSPTKGTYSYDLYPQEQYNHTTVKVLSQGLQVLGTLLPPPTQSQAAPTPAPSGDTTGATSTTTTLNGQQQIVILAVPMQEAEVIKFAQLDGSISLVLRSSKDCDVNAPEGQVFCPVIATSGITLRRLVDDRGVLPPTVVQVIQPSPYPARGSAATAPSASASPLASGSPAPTVKP